MLPKKPKPECFNTSHDSRYSNEAVPQIGELRGEMVMAAEQSGLPDRFIVEQHAHTPAMIFFDSETGRSTMDPLFAYGAVRDTLNDLYGPPKPTLADLFDDFELPMEMDYGSMKATAGWSPYIKECACYILDMEGADNGELGIGRVEMREDGLFHLLTPRAFVGSYPTLDEALQTAEDEIVPLHAIGFRS